MKLWIALVLLCVGVPSMGRAQRSPYAGQEDRPIKALADAEILSYLNGEGMGYAKAAELNRYPGPRHVLDLADSVGLTESQKQRVQKIYDGMHEKAARLGKNIVSREAVLDSLFGARTIDSTQLASLVGDIARLQGELRTVHLLAHLDVTKAMAPDQIMKYEQLRGYHEGREGGPGDDHTKHGMN